MRTVKTALVTFIALIIVWIDIPRAIPIHFSALGKTIDFTIAPMVIDTNLFGNRITKTFDTKLGLDLQGGSHFVFQTDTSNIPTQDVQDAVEAARNVIERRVNLFGVTEPQVRTIKSGNDYRISVDLPGIQNTSQAIGLIGQTAQLSFREQPDSIDPTIASESAFVLNTIQETGLTGKDVKKSTVTFNNQNGEPEVALTFSEEGKKLFADITSRNVGKPVGIYLDSIPLMIPTVQQAIVDGNAVITGNFNTEQAKELAIAINSGALPVPIQLVEQRNVGPTLGALEIQKSVMAGIIGIGIVMLFMMLFYKKNGIIASMALCIYALINFAIFRSIPIVLTLPGVAGFLLSIGMAVDSNILIFERIKEEQRKGATFAKAFSKGFGRAMDAIKDANITTLLVAFILFNPLNWEFLPQFGLVRGFALTLAIGVITSLFTGVVITKRLMMYFYKIEN
ncbi:protein translocase subunit SecD [Candidatus Woesebacteria bacterium]|nr:protein translocase subunit SecD [Candidatus Woesebacteria bacterium]